MISYCLKPSESYLDWRQQVTLCDRDTDAELPYLPARNEDNKALAASAFLRILPRPAALLFYEFGNKYGKQGIGYQGLEAILQVEDDLHALAASINQNTFNEKALDKLINQVKNKWKLYIANIVKYQGHSGFDPNTITLFIDKTLTTEKDRVYSALVGLEAARLSKKLGKTPVLPTAIEYYSELPEGLARNIAGHSVDTAFLATEFFEVSNGSTKFNLEKIRSIINNEEAISVQKLARSRLFSAFAFGVGPLMGSGFFYFNFEKFGAVSKDSHESPLMKLAYGATMVGSGAGAVVSFIEFLRIFSWTPLGQISGMIGSLTGVLQAGIEYSETAERFDYGLASREEMNTAMWTLSCTLIASGIFALTSASGVWSIVGALVTLLPLISGAGEANNANTTPPKSGSSL